MRLNRIAVGAMTIAVAGWLAIPGVSSASTSPTPTIPRYQHIVEIRMENTSYSTIIGNSYAPQINALASHYGLATNYFGVTHPSEPNYVANIGGSYFGIQDDNQFYCTAATATTDPNCAGTTVNHTVSAQNLADQLTAAGKTWKGYFQNLPPVPPTGLIKTGPNANGPYTYKYPSSANALYASKHNPFVNFTGTQDALGNMVPDTQLATDLATGKLPKFSLVVPDQCHDMHGTGSCSDTNGLISAGDTYVGNTVREIMASKTWSRGLNAIVITWDEDDFSDAGQPGTGCCGSDPGGGHVVTIVITNEGTHHITDNTAYNHYSLLRSYEAAFGLPCLAGACDTAAGVKPMARLFLP
ncbi:MAG TPA: alkaline phosphatase family protein [Streptosporangiaceae bacterium]|nr:alkaline phosphatase family protein [Streptosporangiaceae bacterium]